ncbi:uncharacterized protein CTRU02_206459 [Colletotrichum truncatum]|uniref:Uncharacterized protein n=1 Tax=Colletotrichum truncatum TaxID=5467 RepID=A0ACC3Z6X8_COLTU|nr:uncharacterized protein CTRU02_15215 [Colletotrichum truncatum]KAF6781262.1 hypothetical protein CTRU02_15215 [Colletotrichum truncatum]
MKSSVILSVIGAALAVASAIPDNALENRQAKRCKIFQIFRSPDQTSGGAPGFVGTPTCCCQNAQCHVVDIANGINTSANLNIFLDGDFRIIDARSQDKGKIGSNDIRGATYTVASQGGCTK